MLTHKEPRKPGPKSLGFVELRTMITPELNAMLDRVVRSTGIAKAALVRDALARYGESLDFLPPGSAELIPPTRTSGPGLASDRKD